MFFNVFQLFEFLFLRRKNLERKSFFFKSETQKYLRTIRRETSVDQQIYSQKFWLGIF